MTPTQRAAMEQALGCLVRAESMYGQPNAAQQDQLRAALEQPAPVQEPVVTLCVERMDDKLLMHYTRDDAALNLPDGEYKLYTAPQAQHPAPPANVPLLTGEELKDAIRHLYQDETALQMSIDITLHEFRAIEKLVRQKAGLP